MKSLSKDTQYADESVNKSHPSKHRIRQKNIYSSHHATKQIIIQKCHVLQVYECIRACNLVAYRTFLRWGG